jgi:CheY-like chemotaxis protein
MKDAPMYRVLLVDDTAIIRMMIAEFLERSGHTVIQLDNALDAVELLKTDEVFDIIVSDIEMPNLNGIDFGKIVKRDHANIPIIFISGRTLSDIFDIYGISGIVEEYNFLEKPFTQDELDHLITKHVFAQ